MVTSIVVLSTQLVKTYQDEYHDEIFKTYTKKSCSELIVKSKWLDLVFDVNFITLTILNRIFISIFLEFIMNLRSS
jgi:hypothetical protein